jgi:hypothetical protein
MSNHKSTLNRSSEKKPKSCSKETHGNLDLSVPEIKEAHDNVIFEIKEIIDDITTNIFTLHRQKLLSEPITYILPAVWGKKQGNLTVIQDEIYHRIDPVIENIFEILNFEQLTESQRFSLEYLIRGLIISKVTYLIESFRNRLIEENKSSFDHLNLFDKIEPIGNA